MKKLKLVFGLLLSAMVVSGFVAINKPSNVNEKQEVKKLIVFFSHTGNAKFVAEHIKSLTGADVFELKPVDPYPEDFNATLERGKREQEEGKLPALVGRIENFANYDVIFFGTPVWFGSLSLPAQSFLKSYDLSGKTIVPFITFGRGGIMNTITELKTLFPNATILEEFGVSNDDVKGSQSNITQWLIKTGMYKE